MENENTINVYVASIGVTYFETIITRSELEKRFTDAGLSLVLWLPFDNLHTMFTAEMSKQEIEMSSLYAAAAEAW